MSIVLTPSSRYSHSFVMPHVFVFPPEEEQSENPPWCYFDANHSPDHTDFASSHNARFLDVPFDVVAEHQDPSQHLYHSSINESAPTGQILGKSAKPHHDRASSEIRSDVTQHRDPLDDSDVVEVVKLRRSDRRLTDEVDQYHQVKGPRNLRARASKAFQSIKNARKNVRRRSNVKELQSSSESIPGSYVGVQNLRRHQREQQPPAPPASFLSRRNTRSLSQLLQSSKRMSTKADAQGVTSISPAHTTQPPSSETESSLPYLKDCSAAPPAGCIIVSDDIGSIYQQPVSPCPSVKKSRRRFSFRELHHLFPSSSSPPTDRVSRFSTAPITRPGYSQTPSTSSLSTFAGFSDDLEVPMEERVYDAVFFLDSELNPVNRDVLDRKSDQFSFPQDPNMLPPSHDFSFEMRLDSLHFDSLSFDPEDFAISRDGAFSRIQ